MTPCFSMLHLRLVTGKSRRTHLLGYNTLMALRESTVPIIRNTFKSNPQLPKLLKNKVKEFVQRAKNDVEKFYDEVTGKRSSSRKEEEDGPKRRKQSTSTVPIAKKHHDREAESSSEKDEQEEKEEEEEPPSQDEDDDDDVFNGRFASPTTPTGTPSSREAPVSKKPSFENKAKFEMTVLEMLSSAVNCDMISAATHL